MKITVGFNKTWVETLGSRFLPAAFFHSLLTVMGAQCGVVVKALCYKPAGRRFDSRWCHWDFSVT
jgi:hypothetical protein